MGVRPRKLFVYQDEWMLANARLAKHKTQPINPNVIVDKKILMHEAKATKALADLNSEKLLQKRVALIDTGLNDSIPERIIKSMQNPQNPKTSSKEGNAKTEEQLRQEKEELRERKLLMMQAKKVQADLNAAKTHGSKPVEPEDLMPKPGLSLNRMLQESKVRAMGI